MQMTVLLPLNLLINLSTIKSMLKNLMPRKMMKKAFHNLNQNFKPPRKLERPTDPQTQILQTMRKS